MSNIPCNPRPSVRATSKIPNERRPRTVGSEFCLLVSPPGPPSNSRWSDPRRVCLRTADACLAALISHPPGARRRGCRFSFAFGERPQLSRPSLAFFRPLPPSGNTFSLALPRQVHPVRLLPRQFHRPLDTLITPCARMPSRTLRLHPIHGRPCRIPHRAANDHPSSLDRPALCAAAPAKPARLFGPSMNAECRWALGAAADPRLVLDMPLCSFSRPRAAPVQPVSQTSVRRDSQGAPCEPTWLRTSARQIYGARAERDPAARPIPSRAFSAVFLRPPPLGQDDRTLER
ncbi:hypothetical protein C8Q73DRAFT_482354 [Cubamyces lactineus]|nr:hypothetical protein C8Q73DRAFT_482354 [Cubamyces lactineus]